MSGTSPATSATSHDPVIDAFVSSFARAMASETTTVAAATVAPATMVSAPATTAPATTAPATTAPATTVTTSIVPATVAPATKEPTVAFAAEYIRKLATRVTTKLQAATTTAVASKQTASSDIVYIYPERRRQSDVWWTVDEELEVGLDLRTFSSGRLKLYYSVHYQTTPFAGMTMNSMIYPGLTDVKLKFVRGYDNGLLQCICSRPGGIVVASTPRYHPEAQSELPISLRIIWVGGGNKPNVRIPCTTISSKDGTESRSVRLHVFDKVHQRWIREHSKQLADKSAAEIDEYVRKNHPCGGSHPYFDYVRSLLPNDCPRDDWFTNHCLVLPGFRSLSDLAQYADAQVQIWDQDGRHSATKSPFKSTLGCTIGNQANDAFLNRQSPLTDAWAIGKLSTGTMPSGTLAANASFFKPSHAEPPVWDRRSVEKEEAMKKRAEAEEAMKKRVEAEESERLRADRRDERKLRKLRRTEAETESAREIMPDTIGHHPVTAVAGGPVVHATAYSTPPPDQVKCAFGGCPDRHARVINGTVDAVQIECSKDCNFAFHFACWKRTSFAAIDAFASQTCFTDQCDGLVTSILRRKAGDDRRPIVLYRRPTASSACADNLGLKLPSVDRIHKTRDYRHEPRVHDARPADPRTESTKPSKDTDYENSDGIATTAVTAARPITVVCTGAASPNSGNVSRPSTSDRPVRLLAHAPLVASTLVPSTKRMPSSSSSFDPDKNAVPAAAATKRKAGGRSKPLKMSLGEWNALHVPAASAVAWSPPPATPQTISAITARTTTTPARTTTGVGGASLATTATATATAFLATAAATSLATATATATTASSFAIPASVWTNDGLNPNPEGCPPPPAFLG